MVLQTRMAVDVTQAPDKFTEQLDAFSHQQLTNLNPSEINRITAHLTITTAFFTGATIFLAGKYQAPKPAYIKGLKNFLVNTFGIAEKNAAGLIESNARMYKRYTLIENAYNQGWQSAKSWVASPTVADNALHTLLQRHNSLSMADLNIEGVKEDKRAPVAIEEITHVEMAPAPASDQTPARRWPVLLWLLLLTLLSGITYSLILPEHLPSLLRNVLQPLSDNLYQLLHDNGLGKYLPPHGQP